MCYSPTFDDPDRLYDISHLPRGFGVNSTTIAEGGTVPRAKWLVRLARKMARGVAGRPEILEPKNCYMGHKMGDPQNQRFQY
jgi:hypothetical protein